MIVRGEHTIWAKARAEHIAWAKARALKHVERD